MVIMENIKDGSLNVKFDAPKNLNTNEVTQNIRGGLSRYGLPLSNRNKKFSLLSISLLIEAYCIASISRMLLKIPKV